MKQPCLQRHKGADGTMELCAMFIFVTRHLVMITMIGRMVELATMRQLLRDSFIWRKSMFRYQPADIAFSERRTVFSRKSFKERQCLGTKIRAYFEAK